jgi:hypothetical protein|tara:strand:- start:5645 stop:6139 length:495 start_codon:yes stop_codon:yes gene_type:complete
MAAVAAAPVALTSGVPSALLAPAPVEDTRFYASLAPTQCLPLLAVSGVTGKAFWIGSLPQPPEEEEETDDESDRELSDGEDDALDADAAAVKVRSRDARAASHGHGRPHSQTDRDAKNPGGRSDKVACWELVDAAILFFAVVSIGTRPRSDVPTRSKGVFFSFP